jgi:hypothetical protein
MSNVTILKCPKSNLLLAKAIQLKDSEFNNTTFFSQQEDIIQAGMIIYPPHHSPPFHNHHSIERSTIGTCECLYILSGSGCLEVCSLDYFDEIQRYEFCEGTLLILLSGAHRILSKDTQLRMLEVKNGPYDGTISDKIYLKI